MKHHHKSKKLAIIGGGAAAFFCVALLAESTVNKDLEIAVFEMLDAPMQKLLATGGGRCNLTHNISDFKTLARQYPRGEKFLYSLFSQFGVEQTRQWFEGHGIKTYIAEDNSVFPLCDSAAQVADMLLKTAQKLQLSQFSNEEVVVIEKESNIFVVKTQQATYTADYVLLATGGMKSIKPKIDIYNGFELAKSLGHSIVKPALALTPLLAVDKELGILAGIVMKNVTLQARQNQKPLATTTGDLLFTHRGLSGPAAINLSSYLLSTDFNITDPIEVFIVNENFKNYKEADTFLIKAFDDFPQKNIINIVVNFYPRNISKYLLTSLNIDPKTKAHTIKKEQRNQLAQIVKEIGVQIKALDLTTAMVTCGGVSCDEITARTMQSRLVEGLYFAGEVVNVDGLCGGFNLQFAWSSAFAVAKALEEHIKSNKS